MFKLKVFLPSQKKFIYVKELNYKTYRNLVKSLYVGDSLKTIELFNFILQDIVEKNDLINLSILDKLAIFLTVRDVCVSPDLSLKCTCPDTNTEFNFQISINDIQATLNELNTEVIAKTEGLITKHNLYPKIEEEAIIHAQKKHNNISYTIIELVTNKSINLIDYKLEERKNITEQLPAKHLQEVYKQFEAARKQNTEKNLIKIVSPFTQKELFKITGNLTSNGLSALLEYLFIEELNNVYKAMYNIVTHCKFSAEYVDSITPAEIQVYWGYFLEESNKKNNNSTRGASTSTPSGEFGF